MRQVSKGKKMKKEEFVELLRWMAEDARAIARENKAGSPNFRAQMAMASAYETVVSMLEDESYAEMVKKYRGQALIRICNYNVKGQ